DQDQKILHVDFVFDWTGAAINYAPSALTKESLPSHDPAQPIAWLQDGELTEAHEVSVVVTAHPAGPNDNRRYYRLRYKPDDVATLLPGGRVGIAEGPPVQVRIDPGQALARFAWQDGEPGEQIKRMFRADVAGVRDFDPTELLPKPTNLHLLESVAKAAAARVYLSFV